MSSSPNLRLHTGITTHTHTHRVFLPTYHPSAMRSGTVQPHTLKPMYSGQGPQSAMQRLAAAAALKRRSRCRSGLNLDKCTVRAPQRVSSRSDGQSAQRPT